jgi:hypothetical protein
LLDVHADPITVLGSNTIVVKQVDIAIPRERFCSELIGILADPTASSEATPTIILCYLITSRLVLVEIVLAIESADGLDLTVQGNGGAEGWKEGRGLEFLCRMSFWMPPFNGMGLTRTG